MRGDGRNVFFRQTNLDKHDMQFITAYLKIKQEMMKEKSDSYINGKIHTK